MTSDEVRKDYTGYEKDEESGLEFAQARYYNPTHGRFTSVDPLTASATIKNPQTFNRYSYGLNSPYKFIDPLGLLSATATGACGGWCQNSDSGIFAGDGALTAGGTENPFEAEFDAIHIAAEPYAGGVQLAPGLTESQVKSLVDAYYELYNTETGYTFFNNFFDIAFNSTLILNAGDLSDKDNAKTGSTMGLTTGQRDASGHVTITITLDIARIDKAVTNKRQEEEKNKDRVFGKVTIEGVKTRQDVAKHELSHALHAQNDLEDYVRQVAAGTDEKAREIYQSLPGWKAKPQQLKHKDAKEAFRTLIRSSSYTFKTK